MPTQFAKASYTEIYDLSTQQGEMSVLKFHTPVDTRHRNLMAGFFTQFKQFKYVGAKITMVPVATLPADPLQVGFEAGEPTIDPRDLVNPILHKGYKGERLRTDTLEEERRGATPPGTPGTNVDDILTDGGLSEVSVPPGTIPQSAQMEQMYYMALTDPSFKKSHVQRGFNQWTYPLARRMVSNSQVDAYVRSRTNQLANRDINSVIAGVNQGFETFNNNVTGPQPDNYPGYVATNRDDVSSLPIFEWRTSGYEKLGWMDTSGTGSGFYLPAPANIDPDIRGEDWRQSIGKFYTYLVLMPPAYKQEMYFRVVIKHYFNFKKFRGAGISIDGAFHATEVRGDNAEFIDPPIGAVYASAPIKQGETGSIEATSANVKLVADGVS